MSRLEVPAQELLAVWQSLLPAFTTPKHFSNLKSGFGAGSDWANAAGAATAPASAAARMSLVDSIGNLRGWGWLARADRPWATPERCPAASDG